MSCARASVATFLLFAAVSCGTAPRLTGAPSPSEPTPSPHIESTRSTFVGTSTPPATPTAPPTATLTLAPSPTPEALSITNYSRFGQIATLGKGAVINVAWWPDDRTLAVTTRLGIYLMDSTTLEDRSVTALPAAVGANWVSFASQDTTYLLVRWKSIEVYSAGLSEPLATIEVPGRYSTFPVLSPDGRLIAGPDQDGSTYWVWDSHSGELLYTLTGHPGTTAHWATAFSPDSLRLATGDQEGYVMTWDMTTGAHLLTMKASPGITAVQFSSDGTVLGACSESKAILWDATSGTRLASIDGGGYGFAFSIEADRLATAVWRNRTDSTLRVFSISGKALLYELALPMNGWGLALSPNGETLAVYDWGAFVELRSISDGQLLASLPGFLDPTGLSFTPDGTQLLAASGRQVKSWSTVDWSEQNPSLLDVGAQGQVAFSPDGRTIAISRYDMIEVADLHTEGSGEGLDGCMRNYPPQGFRGFSPDGLSLIAACAQDSVTIWQTDTWQHRSIISTHQGTFPNDWVTDVAFHPDGAMIATAGLDGRVNIWDTNTLRRLRSLSLGGPKVVWRVGYSPDGSLLAASGSDQVGQTTVVWETTTWTELATFDSGDPVTFSPDGRILLSLGGTIDMRDTHTFQVIRSVPNLNSGYLSAIWSPDGRYLAIPSGTGSITIWGITP